MGVSGPAGAAGAAGAGTTDAGTDTCGGIGLALAFLRTYHAAAMTAAMMRMRMIMAYSVTAPVAAPGFW